MESLRGRKLRPLFRTPPASFQTSPSSARVAAAAAAFSSCSCLAHSHRAQRMEAALLPLRNQYYWTAAAAAAAAARKVGMEQQQVVRREGSTTRWNPTKEQLRALEELYARGTRTPPAHQIQLIAAQLRRYGRIEGKNVFYWFQNHKARERQRRLRRQAEEEDAAAAAAASDDHNKQETGGAAASAAAAVLKQESKISLAPGKSHSSTPPPAPSAAARGGGGGGGGGRRGEAKEPAQSPWLPPHQQSWAEEGVAWRDSSASSSSLRHQQSPPPLPLAAAAAAAAVRSPANMDYRSRAGARGQAEFAAEEDVIIRPAALELFPLRSENGRRRLLRCASPGAGRKPSTTPHVQFFQFL